MAELSALMSNPAAALHALAHGRPRIDSDFIASVGGQAARAAANSVAMPSYEPLPAPLLEPGSPWLADVLGDTQLRVGQHFALANFVTAAPPAHTRTYPAFNEAFLRQAFSFTPRPQGVLPDLDKGALPTAPPPLLFADVHKRRKTAEEKEEKRRRKEEKERRRVEEAAAAAAAAAAEQTAGGTSAGGGLSTGTGRVASPPPVQSVLAPAPAVVGPPAPGPAAAPPARGVKNPRGVKSEEDLPPTKRARPIAEPAKPSQPPAAAVQRDKAAKPAPVKVERESTPPPPAMPVSQAEPLAVAPPKAVVEARPAAPAVPPMTNTTAAAAAVPPPRPLPDLKITLAHAMRAAGPGYKLVPKCPKIDSSLKGQVIVMRGVGDRGENYWWGKVRMFFKKPSEEGFNVEVGWGGGSNEIRDARLLAAEYVGDNKDLQESVENGWALLRKT